MLLSIIKVLLINNKYMNILKKILASLIILTLSGQMSTWIFADEYIDWELNYTKDYIISDIKWWAQVIARIDTIVEKLNPAQTQALKIKLAAVKEKIEATIYVDAGEAVVDTAQDAGEVSWDDYSTYELSKEEKILLIVEYIELKIEAKESSIRQEKNLIEFSQTLSEEENKKVNAELVKIQKNILTHGTTYLENIIGEFEEYTNYQEKGNFKAHVDIDHEMVGKIKAELELSDYEINNSNFDAQMKTKMKALIDAAPRWEEALKLEISWMLDFILKDQNYYLLLKELNIVDDWAVEEIEEFIQVMQDIAATNKYIHFEDKATAQAMEVLRSFSPQNILTQGNEIVSKPLFKAYKKEWERYFLIPTKYACDTAKELTQKFDPFNGSECTQGQYEDLLDDLSNSKVEFYIELGNNTTIGFDAKMVDDDIEVFNWSVVFSDDYIEELHFAFTPNQEEYPNEWVALNYERNKLIDAYFYVDSWEVDMKLTSVLNRNNNFTDINLTIKAEDFNWELILDNKKITWSYSGSGYQDQLTWSISWRMDNVWKLAELKINSYIENTGTYSPYENTSRFEYSKGQMLFVNNWVSEWTKADFTIWASWSPTNKELVAWNLALDIKSKDSSYDYDSYETIYSWDYKKVFETDITLKNKWINWKTTAIKDWEVILTIDHSGQFAKNYFSVHNQFETSVYEALMWDEWNVEWNLNLTLDQRNNKNNGNVFLDILLNTQKVLEIEIDNQSTKTYKDINIIAPTNTIELEEVIDTPDLYNY